MLFPVRNLIKGQRVVCARLGMSFHDALDVMVPNKFSQLPVIDEKGTYLGMLSEHSIVEHLHDSGYHAHVLQDTIDRWYGESPGVPPDTDMYEILDRLKPEDGVAIVDDERHPLGVVTHFDTAQFYGTYAYGFMLIEYIERTLRSYIESVYPEKQDRDNIVDKAWRQVTDSPSNGSSTRPSRYEDFTLRDYLDLIRLRQCWKAFERYFGAKQSFSSAMGKVPDVRNDAMHFRHEKLSEQQLRILKRAANYLKNVGRQYPPAPAGSEAAPATERGPLQGDQGAAS